MSDSKWVGWVALAAVITACGSSENDGAGGSAGQAGQAGSAGHAGQAGAAGQAGSAGQAGGPSISCESAPGDHASCVGTHCGSIVVDQVIDCDDPSFGERGQRVALIQDKSYVAASTLVDMRMYEVSSLGVNSVPDLALKKPARPVALAASSDGTLHAASDETDFAGAGQFAGGLVVATRNASGFSAETIASSPHHMVPFTDLVVDASGRPHVFLESDPPGVFAHAAPDANGAWQSAAIDHPGDDWARFSIAPSGDPVAFGYAQSAGGWQLLATFGASTAELGTLQIGAYPRRYRPFPPARSGGGPELGALIAHADALRVAWASSAPAGFDESMLPESAAPDLKCAEGFTTLTPPCPETCVEKTSGVHHEAYAVATTETHAYVAFSRTHFDRDVYYEVQEIDGVDRCVGQHGEDRSSSELVLTRVAFAGGAVETLLSLPMDNLGRDTPGAAERCDAGPVALSLDGSALAVSVRTRRDASSAQLRVLHVSTGP